jgi:hypothetical protein
MRGELPLRQAKGIAVLVDLLGRQQAKLLEDGPGDRNRFFAQGSRVISTLSASQAHSALAVSTSPAAHCVRRWRMV